MFEGIGENIPLSQEDEKTIELAELYAEFPAIKDVSKEFNAALEKGGHRPEFVQEMQESLNSLTGAVETLELSLKNQKEYDLVDKRWLRDPDFMHSALASGRLTMELDVRMDAEGGFWISHAVGARNSLMPPFIHKMTSSEMELDSRRFSLEESLEIFSKYKANGHRLILELKSLGKGPENFDDSLEHLQQILQDNGTEEHVSVSSLSPGLLMATHKAMPNMPLILNGGIIPGISYTQRGDKLIDSLVPADKKWRAFGLNPFGELVVTAGDTVPMRADGEGTQTGYILSKLPEQLVEVLRDQHERGVHMGGMASLSSVTIGASMLDAVGNHEKASEMRKYYNNIVDQLGLGKMAATWGQNLSKIPRLSRLDPQEQVAVFKRELGLDTLIYTKSPETWAHTLPEDITTFIQEHPEEL